MNKRHLKECLTILFIISSLLIISFCDIVFFNKTFKVTTANPQALTSGPFQQEKNKPAFFPVMSTDSSLMEEPFYEFIKNSFRRGIIPLWNPYQAGGYPFIAIIELGMFFPLNFLLYTLPPEIAWDMLILARFLIAGLLTYYFMRTLRYRRTAALTAAIAFMLSGPMVLLQYCFANVEILVPLVLITLEYLIKRPTLRQSALTALAIALTFFAGHPEHIFFVNGFAFFYFCFRIFTIKPVADKKKGFYFLFLSYLVCIALAGVVLFPFLRNIHGELWHNHPPNLGLRADGDWAQFITFAVPHFFQKEPVKLDFTRYGWSGYIGIMPLVLAFLSLLKKQRQGLNYFFFLIAFLIICKSFFAFPFINWIGYLPVIKDCRFFVHTSHLFAWTVAVCAGMGVQAILNEKKIFWRGFLFGLTLGIIIISYLLHFRKANHFQISLQASLSALLILIMFQIILFLKDKKPSMRKLAGGLLVLLLFTELFLYINRGRANRFNSFPPVPYLEFLKNFSEKGRAYGTFWTLYPNTASGYQVDDLGFASGLLPTRYVNFVNNFLIPNYFQKNLRHSALQAIPVIIFPSARPFLDLINQRFTVMPQNFNTGTTKAILNKEGIPIYNKEVLIYAHPTALQRAFIVHRAIFEPDSELAVQKLRNLNKSLGQVIVIQHKDIPEITQQITGPPPTNNSRAIIRRYSANEVIVDVELENPGFLVLGDSYHPDWQAFVDGTKSEVFLTDTLIRSVFVPTGQHSVQFIFKPFSFYIGVWTSALTLMFILAILVLGRTTSQKNSL